MAEHPDAKDLEGLEGMEEWTKHAKEAEILTVTETTLTSWQKALAEFEIKMWPLFKIRGYTKGEAIIAWKLNLIQTAVENVEEALRENA